MPQYRFQVTLPYDSGLPEDVAVNTWHAICDDDAAATAFMGDLTAFYAAIDVCLGDLLSTTVAAASIKIYDLADPEPRVPVQTTPFTLVTGGISLPPEVAFCLSFEAQQLSGQPAARRRGRIYLGPIASAENAGGRPSFTGSGIGVTVKNAAQVLLDASQAAATYSWAVYSPTDGLARAVERAWVDDEWDTQRRRGRNRTRRDVVV